MKRFTLICLGVLMLFSAGCKSNSSSSASSTASSPKVNEEQVLSKNGHEYVDLGLPSGTKWATCNLGSTIPEAAGLDYAWGETKNRYEFEEESYRFHDDKLYDLEYAYSKYQVSSYSGSFKPDKIMVLSPNDDAARSEWGAPWRMPTKADFYELMNACKWTWRDDDNPGYEVTGTNGKSLFFPAIYGNHNGYPYFSNFWTSELCDNMTAYTLYIEKGMKKISTVGRIWGVPIRPVFK